MNLQTPKHVFKILRAMFVLWLLKKLTFEEYLPLTVYGRFVCHKGDVTVIQGIDGNLEIGEVQRQRGDTVYIRIFRRPK